MCTSHSRPLSTCLAALTFATLALAGAAVDLSAQDNAKLDTSADTSAKLDTSKLDRGIPEGDQVVPVFVRMTDQLFRRGADYPAFCKREKDAKRRALRREIIADLKKRADSSWRKIAELVEAQGDGIRNLQRYWVVNGFACVATGKACRALATSADVSFVYLKPNRVPALHKTPKRNAPQMTRRNQPNAKQALAILEKADAEFPPVDDLAPTWNLKRIQAVDAWKTGAFGQGVTIALLDSGLLVTPGLARALWRNPKEKLNGEDDDGNGYVDDLFGYDFMFQTGISIGDPRFPCHGSICGGIMAGRPIKVEGIEGKYLVTGIAPQSRLMVLRGMGLIKAYEYALDHGADIVSMSYMWVRVPLGNYRGLYRLAHENMTAAGIVSVGGSGNFGQNAPKGEQIALPKDIPCVIAASGLNADNKMPAFSSLGPCTWDGVKFYDDYPDDQPLMKPDVTGFATGYPCWTTTPRRQMLRRARWEVTHDVGNGVALVTGPQGNSFSGPHAGGVAALMLSANPDLPAWRVKDLMEATCEDLGEKGRDFRYGAGLLNAAAAVEAARKSK